MSSSSKYYWPLLGQESMVTAVQGGAGTVPPQLQPVRLREELTTALHVAPGITLHSVQSHEGGATVLAYNEEEEVVPVTPIASVDVEYRPTSDLLIQRTTTFRLYFLADYPESAPVVHILVDGDCNECLLDQYDDPRIDYDTRQTLYMLRMCNPSEGWMDTYTVECVVFGLRWTLTRIDAPSKVSKGNVPLAQLGSVFARDVSSPDGPLSPKTNGTELQCASLHHEEQGYRDSMEDVVLGLDETGLAGVTGVAGVAGSGGGGGGGGGGGALPYRFYAVFDGHGGDYSARYAGTHLPQHMQRYVVEESRPIRESLYDACRRTDEDLIAEIDKQFVQDTSGSTMCAVVIDPEGVLTCANIGDSRAVLCRAGQAVPLCRDQKVRETSV